MATAKKTITAKSAPSRARKEMTPQASKSSMPAATMMAATGPISGEQAAEEADASGEAMVIAQVPTPFRLTMDNHQEIAYEAGAILMPKAHAEHWYAKANGVRVAKEL